MKKFLIIVLSLVIVGLSVAVVFKWRPEEDPYAGNYVFVTGEERLEVASQVSSLIENTKNVNTEMTGNAHATYTQASYTVNMNMGSHSILDYTDPDRPIAYQKYTLEIKEKSSQLMIFMEMDMYVDAVEDMLYVDYYDCMKVGRDILSENRKKGYLIYSESEGVSANEMMAMNQINSQFDLETILKDIQFSEVNVSVSGNKIKVVETGKTEGDATYYIINDNDSYRAKKEMVLRNVANTGSDLFLVTEIKTTDKTISLPKNLEAYSEKFEIEDDDDWFDLDW